jgi:hypothetical protein
MGIELGEQKVKFKMVELSTRNISWGVKAGSV